MEQGSVASLSSGRPVAVEGVVSPKGGTVRVAVVVVTWNRRELVSRVLEDLAAQSVGANTLDVVMVDNASTDGTLEHLRERFAPERVVENPTVRADEPAFRPPQRGTGTNRAGFASMTIVRNHANLGGCGGFNTGFAFVERVLDAPDASARPEFVWLVDDDVRLPSDACAQLARAMRSDGRIGLVGSRTVHIDRREETIETTIYYDPETGDMGDTPGASHPRAAEHSVWVASTGGTKGARAFTGLRDVDVVSACSLLARWSDVKEIGYWDRRYFIYCDDADWSLRFGRAGRRVVCNLDAMVFHTPWHYKLTPARLYYAQRNAVWMAEKVLAAGRLRPVIARRLARLVRDSLKAFAFRRLVHAGVILRTVEDVCLRRGGKLDFKIPEPEALPGLLLRLGLVRPDRRVALLCARPAQVPAAKEFAGRVRAAAAALGAAPPKFVEVVSPDVRDAGEPGMGVVRVECGTGRWPRVWRAVRMVFSAPDAAVVFDNTNDFPLMRCPVTIHVDSRDPERALAEPDTLAGRASFLARLVRALVLCVVYIARLKPYARTSRYG